MLKAVIFDMDGVLIDSEPVHLEAHRRLMEKLGLPFDKQYYMQFVGSTTDNMWSILKRDFNINLSNDELMKMSDEFIKEINGTEGYPVMAGASDMIKRLSEDGLKLAIASSSGMERINYSINKLGVADKFDAVVSGLTVKNPKPAPDTFLEAAKRLGVSPKECVVVEDSVNGMKAAKNAGMVCIMYENASMGEQNSEYADYILQGFEDVDSNFFRMAYAHTVGEPRRALETKRLYMREIQIDDLDELYEVYSHEGMTDYIEPLYEDRNLEEEYTKAYIEHMYKFYGYGLWVVCLKENDRIIGRAGISNREVDSENKLELGYIIAKPYWRKGYAYEACKAVCEFAKEELSASDMVAFIDKDNLASVNLAKKLGFDYVESIKTSENVIEYYRKIL